jgi:hypothetical protein
MCRYQRFIFACQSRTEGNGSKKKKEKNIFSLGRETETGERVRKGRRREGEREHA